MGGGESPGRSGGFGALLYTIAPSLFHISFRSRIAYIVLGVVVTVVLALGLTEQLSISEINLWESSKLQALPSTTEVFTLYELYYNKAAWKILHNSPPYHGMCVNPGLTRPNSKDLSAPALLPLLLDSVYQKQLCEYGAMFAVSQHLSELQKAVPWVGFQSWKAWRKKLALSSKALKTFVSHLQRVEASKMVDKDVFYYWATWNTTDMYESCQSIHHTCKQVFSVAFNRLFLTSEVLNQEEIVVREDDPFELPPLPPNARGYSLCSYWAMHRDTFEKFMSFARMFFVVLEASFNLHDDVDRCPLSFKKKGSHDASLCWCFIMERLVNIWVYHTGKKMVWVNLKNGTMEEQLPLAERQDMWKQFSEESMTELSHQFSGRLVPSLLELYHQL